MATHDAEVPRMDAAEHVVVNNNNVVDNDDDIVDEHQHGRPTRPLPPKPAGAKAIHESSAGAKGGYEMLQIVNDVQEFNNDLAQYMRNVWHLYPEGFNYNVVSVFGSQSTGKSTLLNRLFSTTFAVMDEAQRSQTTKGIWCSRAPTVPLVVLDVEGTDGHERAQNEDFERKSSLFALAISEVLIVNMFENQVGLYKGANMALLRTVLEVNLQIFQDSSAVKTCLLFVIRDYEGLTPLSNHEKVLRGNLETIWSELSKPAGKEDWKLDHLFDIKVFGIPHKNYKPEEFVIATAALQTYFYDKKSENYIFNSRYHKHIPADGFAMFLKSVWDKIVDNKDLDLPSQQLLLAQFRCDEILREVFAEFHKSNKSVVKPLESGSVVEDLGAKWTKLTNKCLKEFAQNASRYAESVYNQKRQELLDLIQKDLYPHYLDQLQNLNKASLQKFYDRLDGMTLIQGDGSQDYNGHLLDGDAVPRGFATLLASSLAVAEKYYIEIATSTKLTGDVASSISANWSHTKQLNELKKELETLATERYKEAISKIVKQAEESINDGFELDVIRCLDIADPRLWSQLTVLFQNTVRFLVTDLEDRFKSFGAGPDDVKKYCDLAKKDEWKFFYELLTRESREKAVVGRLVSYFDKSFSLKDGVIPRIWSATEEIDREYSNSRANTLKVLDLISICKLDFESLDPVIAGAARSDMVRGKLLGENRSELLVGRGSATSASTGSRSLPNTPMKQAGKADSSSTLETRKESSSAASESKFLVLIGSSDKTTFAALAEVDFKRKFNDARTMMMNKPNKLPIWVPIMMLILGWNELMAVLSSKYSIMLFIFAISVGFMLKQLGLLNPLLVIVRTAIRTVVYSDA